MPRSALQELQKLRSGPRSAVDELQKLRQSGQQLQGVVPQLPGQIRQGELGGAVQTEGTRINRLDPQTRDFIGPPAPQESNLDRLGGFLRQNLQPEEQDVLMRSVQNFNPTSPGAGLIKTFADVVGTAGRGVTENIEDFAQESFAAPISPFRDTGEDPITGSEARQARRFDRLGPLDKFGETAGRVATKAVGGALGFLPELADRLINPEKGGEGQDVVDVAGEEVSGFLDMLTNAPDQVAHLAEQALGKGNPISQIANKVGGFVNVGESREESRKEAINILFKNPESLAFALAIVTGGVKGVTKTARLKADIAEVSKPGRLAEKPVSAVQQRPVAKTKPEITPQQAAKDAGVKYDGVFELIPGKKTHQFTDPKADNTTINVFTDKLSDLPAKIAKKRAAFEEGKGFDVEKLKADLRKKPVEAPTATTAPKPPVAPQPKLKAGEQAVKPVQKGVKPPISPIQDVKLGKTGKPELTPEFDKGLVSEAKKFKVSQAERVKAEKAGPSTVAVDKPIRTSKDAKQSEIYNESVLDATQSIDRQFESVAGADKLTDISNIAVHGRDFFRNTRQVFGDTKTKGAGRVKSSVDKDVIDPIENAKSRNIDFQETTLNELNDVVIKKLKIKRNSPADFAVKDFVEQKVSFEQLRKRFGDKKTADIIEAAKFYRERYDLLLDETNAIRAITGQTPIPRRANYMRHFQDLSGFGGIGKLFETPAGISSQFSAISDFTKPNSKFLSFAQRRLGSRSDRSAMGGYVDYIKQSSHAINIDPQVRNLRGFERKLADATKDNPNLNNYLLHLRRFTDDLAGKTNPLDRIVQEVVGRKAMRALDWVNTRVKHNTILGNAASSLAQIFNVPQAIGQTKLYSIVGAQDAMASIFKPNKAIQKSKFIKERYFQSSFNKFQASWFPSKFGISVRPRAKEFAGWMVNIGDEIATKFIWHSFHRQAISRGTKNPIQFADRMARDMVAGRGVGEVPTLQKSRMFQVVAPFQLEVGNLVVVLKDQVSRRELSSIVTYMTSAWIMNQLAVKIRGNPVSFDPIQAGIEGLRVLDDPLLDTDEKILRAGGRLAGEFLSNIPLGQTAATLYPEFGTTIGGRKLPTRKQLFGSNDPTRFGSGLLVGKGLADPLFKVLPPFGGSQLKKTIGGVEALRKGEVTNRAGKKMFDVEPGTATAVQSIVFGRYATKAAREYFESRGRTKAKKKTKSRGPTL